MCTIVLILWCILYKLWTVFSITKPIFFVFILFIATMWMLILYFILFFLFFASLFSLKDNFPLKRASGNDSSHYIKNQLFPLNPNTKKSLCSYHNFTVVLKYWVLWLQRTTIKSLLELLIKVSFSLAMHESTIDFI